MCLVQSSAAGLVGVDRSTRISPVSSPHLNARQRSEQLNGGGVGLRVESRALGCKENVEECGGVPVGRLDPSDQDLGNSQVQDR